MAIRQSLLHQLEVIRASFINVPRDQRELFPSGLLTRASLFAQDCLRGRVQGGDVYARAFSRDRSITAGPA